MVKPPWCRVVGAILKRGLCLGESGLGVEGGFEHPPGDTIGVGKRGHVTRMRCMLYLSTEPEKHLYLLYIYNMFLRFMCTYISLYLYTHLFLVFPFRYHLCQLGNTCMSFCTLVPI